MSEKAPQFDIMAQSAAEADHQRMLYEQMMEPLPGTSHVEKAQGSGEMHAYLASHADGRGNKLRDTDGSFVSAEEAATAYHRERTEEGEGPKELTDMSVDELFKESMSAESRKHEKAREHIDGVLKSKLMAEAEEKGLSTEPRVDSSSKDKDAMRPSLAEEYVNKTIEAARKKRLALEKPVVEADQVLDVVTSTENAPLVTPAAKEADNNEAGTELSDDQKRENIAKDLSKLSVEDLGRKMAEMLAESPTSADARMTVELINNEFTNRMKEIFAQEGIEWSDDPTVNRKNRPEQAKVFAKLFKDASNARKAELQGDVVVPEADSDNEETSVQAVVAAEDAPEAAEAAPAVAEDTPVTRTNRLKRIGQAMSPTGMMARLQSRDAENNNDMGEKKSRRKWIVGAVLGAAAAAGLVYLNSKGGDANGVAEIVQNPGATPEKTDGVRGSFILKSGENPWDRVREMLEAGRNAPVTDEQVDRMKDEILRLNNMTEEEARNLKPGTKIKY